MQNCMIFANHSVIDHKSLNKIICDLGKGTKGAPNQSGHFAPASLGGINKQRASIEVSL